MSHRHLLEDAAHQAIEFPRPSARRQWLERVTSTGQAACRRREQAQCAQPAFPSSWDPEPPSKISNLTFHSSGIQGSCSALTLDSGRSPAHRAE